MRKNLPPILLFATIVMISSCSPPDTPAQSVIPTLPQANVTCNEFSFYLDPALGNDYKCETVPENSTSDLPKGMSYVFIYPSHTELTIQNYPMTHTQFPPEIWIYPVSRFSELLPDIIPHRVSDLKRLISDGTWNGGELPFLPANPQIQSFFIHETSISFTDGLGVRFITEYSDGPNPITNLNIIYTFQGLTDDGKYWVAVTFPISNPILPADDSSPWPPEGYTFESWSQNYDAYVSQVKDALEAQALDSFSPTIDNLDSLIRSISVKQ